MWCRGNGTTKQPGQSMAHLCIVLKQGPCGLKANARVETGHDSNLASEVRDALPGPLAKYRQDMLKNHGDD